MSGNQNENCFDYHEKKEGGKRGARESGQTHGSKGGDRKGGVKIKPFRIREGRGVTGRSKARPTPGSLGEGRKKGKGRGCPE